MEKKFKDESKRIEKLMTLLQSKTYQDYDKRQDKLTADLEKAGAEISTLEDDSLFDIL